MVSEWKPATLGELLDSGKAFLQTGPFGTALKANEYTATGVPLISVREIREGYFQIEEATPRVDQSVVSRLPKFVLKTGDIVFARKGGIERNALVTEAENGWFLGSDGIFLRFTDDNDSRFFSYVMRSPSIRAWLIKNCEGTTMPSLNQKILSRLPVCIPPLKEQIKVADWLEALDNKISLNRQINQTLEQMAQTLFKSWFVDFDPVIDNALDAGNPIPDELQHRAEARKAVRESEGFKPLPEDVRQLFPDAFEESELGWVPKGWKVTMLGDMCVELRRGISPKYIEEGGIKVINQKCIRNHEVNYDLVRRNNPELRKVDGREVQLGDVLVNSTGVGTLGRMAQVTYIPEPTVVDSHVTLVRVNSDICPMYTFGQLLLSIENRVERLGEGSTGQTELSRKILSEQQVVLPPLTIANHIEATFKSFADKKVASRNEVDSLTKLRDTLLPKLISGELRLDDVEAAVEQETVSAEQQNER
ncbi:restriction endonuclease subunit S [Vibrio cholerae]|nr:restriction endonuclease subunit S [Vibrio cholerae]